MINRDPESLCPVFGADLKRFVASWNLNHPVQPVGIFEGFRTYERQQELYAKGRTMRSDIPCFHDGKSNPVGTCPRHPLGAVATNAPAGLSWHNYGLAADIVFDADPVKPLLQASWDGKFPWDKLGAMGQAMGLEWAGAWRTFREFPHFQKTYGLQITEAHELFRTGGLQAVWAAL